MLSTLKTSTVLSCSEMMMASLVHIHQDLFGLGLLICKAKARKGLALVTTDWKALPCWSGLQYK